MARCYLYYRCWQAFVRDRFPFERFDDLPDGDVPGTVAEYARQWAGEHRAAIDARNAKDRERIAAQEVPWPVAPAFEGLSGPLQESLRPERLVGLVGCFAGWYVGLGDPDLSVLGLREYFFCVSEEEAARELLSRLETVIEHRVDTHLLHPPGGGTPTLFNSVLRLAYAQEPELDADERARIETILPIIPETGGKRPFGWLTRDLMSEAQRITETFGHQDIVEGTSRRGGAPSIRVESENLDPTDGLILRFLGEQPEQRFVTGVIADALDLNPKSIGKNLSKLCRLSLINNVRRKGYNVGPGTEAD